MQWRRCRTRCCAPRWTGSVATSIWPSARRRATAEAFRHGSFHSGDAGRLGADGMLWFSDRDKDVIKSGGENVASMEVEKALYAAEPAIAEVAVVGLPHPRWIEAITAVATVRPGHRIDEAQVLAALREHLAGFKTPNAVIFVDELPKTSTGKIQKTVLREEFRGFLRPTRMSPARDSKDTHPKRVPGGRTGRSLAPTLAIPNHAE